MYKYSKALFITCIYLSFSLVCKAIESTNLDSVIHYAESGDSYYQGVLGTIYRRGEKGEINYSQAQKWLTLSTNNNNPIGLYNLAVLYESGIMGSANTALVDSLYQKSFALMLELAHQGSPRAQVNLGYLLETGTVVKENLPKALKWYEKATEFGSARAQFIIGYKYYYGWGYKRSLEKAVQWFEKAANQNYPEACHFLGNIYANGIGTPKDNNKAIDYFRKAECIQKNSEEISKETGAYTLNGIEYEDDQIIPGLLPPNYLFEIDQGSCGEACLWSIINSDSFQVTQMEINQVGGDPGRGLHTIELRKPLGYFHIKYEDKMRKPYIRYAVAFFNPLKFFSSHSKKYKDYLYEDIISKIKDGNPIILGVKKYPDGHLFWDCDHFILLVGYNEKTNELIFNDFTKRKRINAEKLLDKTEGYSIVNRYNFHNYIEIMR